MNIVGVSISTRIHGIGGMEDHLHTLMGGLAKRGHDVTVLTSRHPEGIEREVVAGVTWVYLDSPRDFFSPEWRTALLAAIDEIGPGRIDVIHSQSSSALQLLDAGLGVPIVLSLHGNFVSIVQASLASVRRDPSALTVARQVRGVAHVARRHFRMRNWRAFRPCDAIVPSRSQVRPSILAHALRADRVHVVTNAIDTDTFRPRQRSLVRQELGLAEDAPTVVVIGRLDRSKGTGIALEGAARAQSLNLVIVGDGPDRSALEQVAIDAGLEGRVRFTGREPQERVALFLAAADLFLFPSMLAEAGPLVVAQAMSSGTPVVASAVGAVPEMLGRDEAAGILVRPGSPAAITEAIDRLLGDPSLRTAMGDGGRQRALERFSLDRMVDETVAVYETAIRRTT